MLFVCSCKPWSVVKPQVWLARLPLQVQQFQDPSPILSMVPHSLHSQQAHSQGSGQAGQKQGQRPSPLSLSLKPERDSNPSLCPDQKCWRSWTVLWRSTRPSRTNTQTRCPFHYRGLECKSRKSRNTWSNRQTWPCGVQNRAGQRLIKFCQKNTVVIANTLFQQHKWSLYIWLSPDTEIRLIIFFAAKDGEALYSQQKQEWELTVAQIMNSLLPNSDLNWSKKGKPLDTIQVWAKSNPLWLYNGNDK